MSDAPDTPKSHGRLSIKATLQPRDLMEEPRVVKGAFTAKIITLFPEAFPGTLGLSLTGKALDFGLWQLETIDLRQFGEGKHRNVDDTPAGAGPAWSCAPTWSTPPSATPAPAPPSTAPAGR
jgi:tRNA (guanine37-N1)-methyltransferase